MKLSYTNPRPGTKGASLVALLVQPSGATKAEIQARGLYFPSSWDHLENDCGYDVRSFDCPIERCSKSIHKGPQERIYRIVGRNIWNGGYKSFINPSKLFDGAKEKRPAD